MGGGGEGGAQVKKGEATFGFLDIRKERKRASSPALTWLLRI